jgi:protein-S-isoprenylcysteine O-methyltransferase Ste14
MGTGAFKIRKDFTPALLSFFLLLGIVVLAILRQGRLPDIWGGYRLNPDNIFIGLYVLWILAEIPIARRDASTEGKTTLDFATCQIYALGQSLIIFSALGFPSVWRVPNAAHFIGIGLLLSGACYRLWAIRTLGVFYSHKVRKLTRHKIVDSGPYRFTRHPAYTGMIVANTGVVIFFFNPMTMCIFLFAFVPAIILRIFIEEKMLFSIEGYSDYASKRKRLFPGIW